MSVSFSPCGGRIASASRDRTIKVWEASTGTCQSTLTVDAGYGGVRSVSFSPKDNVIAAGCCNGKIHLVDVVAGEVKSSLRGHSYGVTSVAFNQEGTLLASSSNDKTVKIWDPVSGEEKCTLSGHWYVPFPCVECLLS